MKKTFFIIFIFSGLLAWSQHGLEFLDLSVSAREAALGGSIISNGDGDVTVAFRNPAVLDSVAPGSIAAMFNPYYADISRFSVIGKFDFNKIGPFAIGTVYTDYGELDRTDDIGTKLGEFTARDYIVSVGKSHRIGSFGIGGNVKFAQSIIDSNSASALLLDMGGIYSHPSGLLYIGLLFSDFGWILSDYAVDKELNIPFDVKVGTTFKPQYMPVRFTFTVYDLISNTETYSDDPQETLDNLDKALRHINIGGAFILGRNLEILLGYNQKRRQELRLAQSAMGAGWSYGLLIRIKDLDLRFSRSNFHAAGGTSFISLQSNVNSIRNIF